MSRCYSTAMFLSVPQRCRSVVWSVGRLWGLTMLLYLLLTISLTNVNGQIDPGNVRVHAVQHKYTVCIHTGQLQNHSLPHRVLLWPPQLTVVILSVWRTGGSKTMTSLPPASGTKPQALSMQGNISVILVTYNILLKFLLIFWIRCYFFCSSFNFS